jgi:hypothetical protein
MHSPLNVKLVSHSSIIFWKFISPMHWNGQMFMNSLISLVYVLAKSAAPYSMLLKYFYDIYALFWLKGWWNINSRYMLMLGMVRQLSLFEYRLSFWDLGFLWWRLKIAPSLWWKVEAMGSFETPVCLYQTVWCHILEDNDCYDHYS